jgi:hypothetical protein
MRWMSFLRWRGFTNNGWSMPCAVVVDGGVNDVGGKSSIAKSNSLIPSSTSNYVLNGNAFIGCPCGVVKFVATVVTIVHIVDGDWM